MKKYDVFISDVAQQDINAYINYISQKYHSPLTALRNYNGLFDTINSLKSQADSFAINKSSHLRQFGFEVRRINYKKMAIIYTMHGNIKW